MRTANVYVSNNQPKYAYVFLDGLEKVFSDDKSSEDSGAGNFRVPGLHDENSLAAAASEAERERVLHGEPSASRGVDFWMKYKFE